MASTGLQPPQRADEIGRLAHYRVLTLLGAGGMGAVYKAEDTCLRRLVALKVMLPEQAANPTARQRFVREAELSAADLLILIEQIHKQFDAEEIDFEEFEERKTELLARLPID